MDKIKKLWADIKNDKISYEGNDNDELSNLVINNIRSRTDSFIELIDEMKDDIAEITIDKYGYKVVNITVNNSGGKYKELMDIKDDSGIGYVVLGFRIAPRGNRIFSWTYNNEYTKALKKIEDKLIPMFGASFDKLDGTYVHVQPDSVKFNKKTIHILSCGTKYKLPYTNKTIIFNGEYEEKYDQAYKNFISDENNLADDKIVCFKASFSNNGKMAFNHARILSKGKLRKLKFTPDNIKTTLPLLSKLYTNDNFCDIGYEGYIDKDFLLSCDVSEAGHGFVKITYKKSVIYSYIDKKFLISVLEKECKDHENYDSFMVLLQL